MLNNAIFKTFNVQGRQIHTVIDIESTSNWRTGSDPDDNLGQNTYINKHLQWKLVEFTIAELRATRH